MADKDARIVEDKRQESKQANKAHVEAVIVHTTAAINSIANLLDKHR